MRKGNDLFQSEYANALIWGEPGIGKTVFVCTAAAHAAKRNAKALAVDIEGGIKGRLLRKYKDSLTVLRPESFKDFNDIYNKLSSHVETYQKLLRDRNDPKKVIIHTKKLIELEKWFTGNDECEEWHPYLHVITDSFSETQKSAMDHIVPQSGGLLNIKNPEIQHWGKNINMILFITRAFRDLQINTWFTAHSRIITDDDDNVIAIAPKFAGKTTYSEVSGMLDIVTYYGMQKKGPKEIVRMLNFQKKGKLSKYVIKDRFDALGDTIEAPTVEKIMNILDLDNEQEVITKKDLEN